MFSETRGYAANRDRVVAFFERERIYVASFEFGLADRKGAFPTHGERWSGVRAMKRGRPFEPGNKLGRGRPPGSRNKKTLIIQEILDEYSPAVIRKTLAKALQGEVSLLRMLATKPVAAAPGFAGQDRSPSDEQSGRPVAVSRSRHEETRLWRNHSDPGNSD
jgi:hypothetical protein